MLICLMAYFTKCYEGSINECCYWCLY